MNFYFNIFISKKKYDSGNINPPPHTHTHIITHSNLTFHVRLPKEQPKMIQDQTLYYNRIILGFSGDTTLTIELFPLTPPYHICIILSEFPLIF